LGHKSWSSARSKVNHMYISQIWPCFLPCPLCLTKRL
jgi:hypothetical protein